MIYSQTGRVFKPRPLQDTRPMPIPPIIIEDWKPLVEALRLAHPDALAAPQ